MTNQPIIGALYEPLPDWAMFCPKFIKYGGSYVRFRDKKAYDILGNNKVKLGDCDDGVCFNLNHLRLVEHTLDTVQEGDILTDNVDHRRLVVGRVGRLVALSQDVNEPDDVCHLDWFTILELLKKGITFADQKPEEKTIEIEGKKFTVEELKTLIKKHE